MNAKTAWAKQMESEGATVFNDVLQEVEDPVATLKDGGDRVAVLVPYEYLWPDNLLPFKNDKFKRTYDSDSLIEDLEKAGYTQSVLRVLQVDNFTFLTAIAVKRPLTSAERRKAARAALQPKKEVKEVVV